jgi:hypothetical protein
MPVLGPNPELGALAQVLFLRSTRLLVMNPNVEHVDAVLILGIEASDVRPRAPGLDDHGDPVELGVSWMKDVSRHMSRYTAAPQNLSKAAVRSAAMA